MKNLKQMRRFYLLLLLGVLISCSQDEQTNLEVEARQNENFVSLSEASAIAATIEYPLSSGSKHNALRASGVKSVSKEVKSVSKVPDEYGNNAYYIINYNDKGFVIIAADKRAHPILAFSNSGKFPTDKKNIQRALLNG